ncbi:MAG: ADP-glyceromanno-heptose 6-epimerase [Candidatus Omnitrophota bacterium]|jgi:ADP-L-glycero-D-manno-heptose 6-epimerase
MLIVTGGAGFIGSCLVWKLNELGRRDILVVDEKGTELPKAKNWNPKTVLDYMEKEDLLKAIAKGKLDRHVDGVFHLGACADTTEQNREYLEEVNYRYSVQLAEWAVKEGIRFLYASSAATYGDGSLGYSDDDAMSAQLKPLNPYGESKRLFDVWVIENRLQRKLTGFKYFNVYGPNEYHKGDMRSMIHKGYQQIKKTGRLKLFKSYKSEYADGGQKRDFVYVKDVLDVMMWFWDHPNTCGIYNVGTGRAETWNELGRGIFEALGLEPKIEYIEMPESLKNQYQYWTQADMTKCRAAGMKLPLRPLKEGIRDYVLNHLEKADAYLRFENTGQPQGSTK